MLWLAYIKTIIIIITSHKLSHIENIFSSIYFIIILICKKSKIMLIYRGQLHIFFVMS